MGHVVCALDESGGWNEVKPQFLTLGKSKMRYFDVWQVDTARHTMRSYVEDEYGRVSSDIGEWEAIPSTLPNLNNRLVKAGYGQCRPSACVDTWKRNHQGK